MFRYWLATDQAKVQLNLAVCPGAWLMSLQIITKSMVGCNKLRQAVPDIHDFLCISNIYRYLFVALPTTPAYNYLLK